MSHTPQCSRLGVCLHTNMTQLNTETTAHSFHVLIYHRFQSRRLQNNKHVYRIHKLRMGEFNTTDCAKKFRSIFKHHNFGRKKLK